MGFVKLLTSLSLKYVVYSQRKQGVHMSLGSLLLGIWLILVGINWSAWVALSAPFLGLWAFITGIVWLIEGVHPIVVYKRPV